MDGRGELPRRIGFWGGSAIMVGIIVGTGIFAGPPQVARSVGAPFLQLLLWAGGGALALCGALAFAELGAAFPRSGGLYVFLHEGYGRPLAFVFGWTYLLIGKPFAAAGISLFMAENLNGLLGTSWNPQVVAVAVLVLLTVVNTLGARLGARVALVLTSLKLLALLAILAAAVAVRDPVAQLATAAPAGNPWRGVSHALYLILFAYDGWSDVTSVAGEVEDPQRRLPRILLTGTVLVLLLYVAVNGVFLQVLGSPGLAAESNVARSVMERVLGASGGAAMCGLVFLSSFGASHGSILTGARVTYAQARDGLLFRFLGHVHPRFGTPDASLWGQLVLSAVAIATLKTFEKAAFGYSFTMWIFYALGAGAVLVLRRKRPDLKRPYLCPAYPWVPLFFILASAGMTSASILASPKTTLPWIGVLLAGLPIYPVWDRLVKRAVDPVV
jgi:amino acid transporter